jgi:DNA-binding NtrC family response regulator
MPQRIRISFVEDDKKEWELLVKALHEYGITENFTFYDTGMQFLSALVSEPPQVVVIDYMLKKDINMNGLKVMLDAKRICEDCYFIIVTGQLPPHQIEDLMTEFINAHADHYMKKRGGGRYYEALVEQILIGRQIVRKRVERKERDKEAEQWLIDKLNYLNEKIKQLPGNDTGAKNSNTD